MSSVTLRRARLGVSAVFFAALCLALLSSSARERTARLVRIATSSRTAPPAAHAGPTWARASLIEQHSARYAQQQAVAPKIFRHLQYLQAPEPLREVYGVSAWLDTRPLAIARPPQVSVLSVLKGYPYMSMPDERFPNIPQVRCYVALKNKGAGEVNATYVVSDAVVTGLPDPHEGEKDLVTAMFTCPLANDKLGRDHVEWRGKSIYVSLSMGQIQPTLDGFLPVGVLPEFDRDEHQTGEGPLAVCLPPLIGDIYAHEMRDFVEYYRALGVTQFYSYVMDPGPASLDVLRRLAKADDFQVVRWGVPIGWQFESVAHQQPKQDFLVDPATWRIPGLEPLDPIIENGLGITEDGFFDIRLWYNGQTPANQDCTFRAMRDGTRWLASLDWDEFLVLRPPEGRWPAPSAGKRPHFIDFARSLEPLWAWPDSMGPPTAHELGLDASALTKGMLPTSYIFRSSFVCESCQPTEPPPPTPMYQQLRRQYPQLNLTHPAPGVPLLFASPVRHDDFFVHGARSKAISDPWAWYTIGIHFPGMGFPQYAVERAPQLCASSWNTTQRSDADKRCGAKLLSTFGPSSFDVRVIEPTTAEGSASLKPHSQGVLFHMRAKHDISQELVKWDLYADAEGIDGIEDAASAALLNSKRSPRPADWAKEYLAPDLPSKKLIQDWSALDIMGNVLIEILNKKRRPRGFLRRLRRPASW